MEKEKLVSVIVPTYKDHEKLESCLKSLSEQICPFDYEVIVVDNESDFTLASQQERWSDVIFEWEPKEGSYSARNKGLHRAKGQYIAFTDSDCVARKTWLAESVASLCSDENIGMIGGKMNVVARSDGSHEVASIANIFDMITAFPQDEFIRIGHYAATGNMVTRRRMFDTIGNFDDSLKSGGDADWGRRCFSAGFGQLYVETAVVDHPARNHSEVLQKMKRLVGGHRDRNPSWSDCIKYVARYGTPPRKMLLKAVKFGKQNLPMRRTALLMAYCILYNWRSAFERVRIQISGSRSSRI